jgi:nitrite reductase (NADH) large subunit
MKRTVIVGAGVAAQQCAERLRRRDPSAGILMLSREEFPAYTRIWLPEVISGKKAPADLAFKPAAWYAEQRIDARYGVRVEGIDRRAGELAVVGPSGAERIGYDDLVLATGAAARRFPYGAPGIAGMFTLRTAADALAIKAYIAERAPKRIGVIGGGLLGLELATALAALAGPRVTVVEVFPYLLPRQVDPSGGAYIRRHLETKGIDFVMGRKIAAVAGGGRVAGVEYEGGGTETFDLLLQQVGIVPETGLAKEAGLAAGAGVVVDDQLRTSDPAIRAIGDCAEHRGVVYGIIPACLEQAEAAAASLAGEASSYAGTTPKAQLKVAGLPVLSVGEKDAGAVPGAVETVHELPERGVYRKAVVADGILRGAVLIGPGEGGWFAKMVGKAVDPAELDQRLRAVAP